MSLSGSRLQGTILSAIQAAFPVNSSLLTAEKTLLNAAQNSIASCMANPTVSEVTGNSVVPSGIAVTVSTGTGIGATTAPGTVT